MAVCMSPNPIVWILTFGIATGIPLAIIYFIHKKWNPGNISKKLSTSIFILFSVVLFIILFAILLYILFWFFNPPCAGHILPTA
jgi:Gpi18-like mannosyltransferase